MTSKVLRIPAIEIQQGARTLYSFGVDGKRLHDFATVSRIRRDEDHELDGYQRPEVLSHIKQIQNYLESDDPLLPNAIVIAFDERVTFDPSDVQPVGRGFTRFGTLIIPADESVPDEEKPGWIVDGQQRSAAIRDADVDAFPLSVTAFITDDDQEQREQFILVNSTKPLPKGLIYELLPATEAKLPRLLHRRRFPAYLLQRLNFDEDSPLCGRIKSPTNPDGFIKDNSILKMLENSLNDGALHLYRDPFTGRGDVRAMLAMLKNYWGAVADVFPTAWDLPPKRSRLTHGVGVVSMGFLMDAIKDAHPDAIPRLNDFIAALSPIAADCSWIEGEWKFEAETRPWNDLQNLSKDIRVLADHLLTCYRRKVWERQSLAVS